MPTTTNYRNPARRWTDEEDQILINKIGENPLNLRMCFMATATLVRRSPAACASRWYGHLQKSDLKEHTAIITMGKHIAIRNKKKFKLGMTMHQIPEGIFMRIVNYLFDGVL